MCSSRKTRENYHDGIVCGDRVSNVFPPKQVPPSGNKTNFDEINFDDFQWITVKTSMGWVFPNPWRFSRQSTVLSV